MKIYCQKCGSPHDSLNKPNFCYKCGNPFNSRVAAASAVAKPVSKVRPQTARYSEDDDIDDDDDGEIDTDLAFSASKLDVEIEKPVDVRVKMGSVMGSSIGGETFNRANEGSNYSIEDFQREAGSLRNK